MSAILPFVVDKNRSVANTEPFYILSPALDTPLFLGHDMINGALAPVVKSYNADGTGEATIAAAASASGVGWWLSETDKDVFYSQITGISVYRAIRILNTTLTGKWVKISYAAVGDYVEPSDLQVIPKRWMKVAGSTAITGLKVVGSQVGDATDEVRLFDKTSVTMEIVGVTMQTGESTTGRPTGWLVPVQTNGLLDGFTGLTIGKKVWGTTAGDYTQDEDTFGGSDRKMLIGVAVSATAIEMQLGGGSSTSTGGSGAVQNFLTNGLKSSNLTGWTRSGNATIAYSTSRDLYDGGALAITKTAGATGMVEASLSEIMSTQVGRTWMLNLFNWIDSGATLAAGDIYFELYDGTTTMAIADSSILLNQLVNQSLPVGPTNVIGSTWKLRIQFKSAAVCTMRIADVSVAPQVGQSVPKKSGWIPYPSTPVPVGFSGVTINKAEYSYDGEDMLLDVKYTFTGTSATEARFPLPSIGVTSKSSIPTLQTAGFFTRTGAGANGNFILIEQSVAYVTFGIQNAGSGSLSKQIGSNVANANESISFQASIPLAQATSSIQVSGEETIYLSNTDATNADNTTDANTYNGIEGSPIPSVATTAKKKRILHRLLGPGEVKRIVFRNATTKEWVEASTAAWSPAAGLYATACMSSGAPSSTVANIPGAGLLDVDTTHTDVWFNASASIIGATAYTWANFAAIYDRYAVRISKGGGGAEVPPPVACTVFLTSNQAVTANNPIPYTGVAEDSHGCWNASTYRYTVKVPGRYKISPVAGNSTQASSLALYKNGAVWQKIGTMPAANFSGTGSVELQLSANDYIDVRCDATVTFLGAATLATAPTILQITRIGS